MSKTYNNLADFAKEWKDNNPKTEEEKLAEIEAKKQLDVDKRKFEESRKDVIRIPV